MDALQAYPELYENTIIVVAGDHGYALGEKRHWQKGTMWETDLRVPFFITDLRMTTTPEVYNVVSLLDIFPTLCTVAGVPLPRTSYGTLYPDGYDLSGQMHSDMPELEWPVLSSYLQQPGTGQGTCFPQHSVRNNRFHFIQYTSNGDSWEEACNAAEAWREEELYEIGTYRDIDPNEWNNLIRQDYYQPVRDYLAQWLPGGDMYLKRTYKSNIISNISECLVDREGVIDVTVTLTDSNGMASDIPVGYGGRWTCTATDDTLYGPAAAFDLGSITDPILEQVGIYFQLIDSGGTVVSLDLLDIYLDNDNTPELYFSTTAISPFTVVIEDVVITGNPNRIVWDFGDGTSIEGRQPGPHTYATTDSYTITCKVWYGNLSDCTVSTQQTVVLEEGVFNTPTLFLYPNPVAQAVFASGPLGDALWEVSMWDISGRMVWQQSIRSAGGRIQWPVNQLPPGYYQVHLQNNSDSMDGKLIISR